MSRPILYICTGCKHGDALHDRVRTLRREGGLKKVFKVESTSCLKLCDAPCALALEEKRRPTIARTHVRVDDAASVIETARAYAALRKGEKLADSTLPGEHAD